MPARLVIEFQKLTGAQNGGRRAVDNHRSARFMRHNSIRIRAIGSAAECGIQGKLKGRYKIFCTPRFNGHYLFIQMITS